VRQPIRRIVALIVASIFLFAAALPAKAGFVASVTGSADVISAPASSAPGSLVSNNYQVWDESTGKLSANLAVDLAGLPGNYDGLTNYSPLGTTLAKGTAYDSVMIQLDPTSPYPTVSPTASINFTNKIIGIALFGTSLDASDIYGNPTTVYPHGLPNLFLQTRGIDFTHTDMLSISSNGKTLTLQLPANFGVFDQIRVFTSVPEPASLFVWSAIGLVFVGRVGPVRILRAYTSRRRKSSST
jgi:hypothetical protein